MLDRILINEILSVSLESGGDFSEVFFEDRVNNSMSMTNSVLEKINSGRDMGVGIRIFHGFDSVYAYTNDLSRENLLKVAREAAKSIKGAKKTPVLDFTNVEYENLNPIKLYPSEVKRSDIRDFMKKASEVAKDYDEKISQVIINELDWDQKVQIANSEGIYAEDRRTRTRLTIQTAATSGNDIQTGYYAPGSSRGIEHLYELDLNHYAKEASRQAVTMLGAKNAPSGVFPVIIDNEFGGVIFHEACGHSLEATSVAKGNSVFSGKLGEKIASSVVNAVDDGTLPNEWGSTNVDDEGEKTRRNLLIENGILKGYMIDKLNSRIMKMPTTGSGRRESYKYAPTSRMTNTFIDKGKSKRDEIIESTEYGILAKYMGGGSVNPITGDFNFSVREGYIIRNGKISEAIRGATLIGKGSEVLHEIDMVADNLGHGTGMCGSLSGSIPANVGQPTIRVKAITVGGRE